MLAECDVTENQFVWRGINLMLLEAAYMSDASFHTPAPSVKLVQVDVLPFNGVAHAMSEPPFLSQRGAAGGTTTISEGCNTQI